VLGQKISWVGNGLNAYGQKNVNMYTYVDCLYIQILQRYGIVFTSCWLIILTATIYRCYRTKDYHLMIILTLIAGHCIIDDLTLYIYFNTFWFAIGVLLVKTVEANAVAKKVRIKRSRRRTKHNVALRLRY